MSSVNHESPAETQGTTSLNTEDDIEALVLGLGILSTGGGGTVERGRQYLRDLRDAGYVASWSTCDDLSSEVRTCSVFGMGSIAPHDPLPLDEQHRLGYRGERFERPAMRAIERLGQHLGEPIAAIVPFELGPFNTVVALDAAARLGLAVVDGDYVGRATPELSQALPALLGHSVLPAAICDQWGNALLVLDAPSPAVVEAIGKSVSAVTKRPDTRGTCAHAAFPLQASDAKEALVPGTLSRALTLGRALLRAREGAEDPVAAIVEATGGRRLHSGILRDVRWDSSGGYMDGTMVIESEDGGREGRIWFRNENHAIWRDGEVLATSPDLIAVVASQTGEPLPNSALPVGAAVTAIGIPGDPRYREEVALRLTGPAHYGLDIEHVPV